MFQSVRVERTSDLPDDQVVTVEFHPDGTVTWRIDSMHISEAGAEGLQVLLGAARVKYHVAWNLPISTAAVLAPLSPA